MDNIKKVSIYDIAKALNTTGSTVSRALKDHPAISEKTKKLVKDKAKELGYKPNSMAINLKRGCTNTIGVVVPYISRNFFSAAIDGIEEEAYENGYDVLICQSRENYDLEKKLFGSLSSGKVDGVIVSIAAGTNDYEHLRALESYGIPLVMFDRVAEEVGEGSVTVDDYKGARLVVDHLVAQGKNKIYHYAGAQNVSVWRNRLLGYRDAMKENGIQLHSPYIYIGEISKEAGIQYAKEILESDERPDAIFATSDFVALGIIIEFQKQGIRVPEDIAVCGFANEPFDELVQPSLTSVNQFSKEMGQEAAKMLIKKLNNIGKLEEVVIDPVLIVRESSQ